MRRTEALQGVRMGMFLNLLRRREFLMAVLFRRAPLPTYFRTVAGKPTP
jgi:hypothetical protein